jgi:Peptidase inhibitor I78 family
MRKAALLVPALLAACSTAPAEPPVHGQIPGYMCEAAGTDQFVGQPATSKVGAAIMRSTHSGTLRWVSPGMMVTMEFSPSRVTVRIDPDHRISAINCG